MGLGCMGMSEFYGPRDDEQAMRVLARAVEMGIDFLDTADMYGPHHNEALIGRFLATHGAGVKVATKFGIVRQSGEYRRTLDNSVQYARQSCEASLRRLGVEQIDLYYVHRIDPAHPIEETMAGLAQLVQHPLALPPPETASRQMLDIVCSRQGLLLAPVLVSNHVKTMLHFVANGGGLSVSSEIAARHLVEAGAVVALPISDPGMDLRDLEVQTLAGRSLPVAVQAFMDLLKERLPGPW